MRSFSYANEIIEQEISSGTSSENIFVIGHASGGQPGSITLLASQHKLGGFIFASGVLASWQELPVQEQDQNKETPVFITEREGK
jgi:predicted esterase